jgi:hypothetical protein
VALLTGFYVLFVSATARGGSTVVAGRLPIGSRRAILVALFAGTHVLLVSTAAVVRLIRHFMHFRSSSWQKEVGANLVWKTLVPPKRSHYDLVRRDAGNDRIWRTLLARRRDGSRTASRRRMKIIHNR